MSSSHPPAPVARALPWLAGLLSGVLWALAAPGIHVWPLALLAPLPLTWAIERRALTPGAASGLGLVTGTVAQLGAFHWLAPMGEHFFELSWLAAWSMALVFSLAQGGQVAVFGLLLGWLRPRTRALGWALAPAWAASEQVWPMLFRLRLGQSLHGWPLAIQIADLGGVTLVSLLLALGSAGLYEALVAPRLRTPDRRVCLVAAAAWMASLGYGAARMHQVDARLEQAPRAQLGLVQPNVAPEEKLRDLNANLRRHIALSRELERGGPLDLLIWPETAMASVLDARQYGKKVRTPLLYGGIEHSDTHRYNTAFLYQGGDSDYRYRKHELLVFGEYVPWLDQFPELSALFPNTTPFRPGTRFTPAELAGHRLSVLICYEDVLDDFVRRVVQRADPQLLVNLTNDAWFGVSTEPEMHLASATFRAVEHRLFLARATQTGVTAVIDPAGRVVARAEAFAPAALRAEVAWLNAGSPYTWLGDWPVRLLAGASLAWLALRRRKRGPTGA